MMVERQDTELLSSAESLERAMQTLLYQPKMDRDDRGRYTDLSELKGLLPELLLVKGAANCLVRLFREGVWRPQRDGDEWFRGLDSEKPLFMVLTEVPPRNFRMPAMGIARRDCVVGALAVLDLRFGMSEDDKLIVLAKHRFYRGS